MPKLLMPRVWSLIARGWADALRFIAGACVRASDDAAGGGRGAGARALSAHHLSVELQFLNYHYNDWQTCLIGAVGSDPTRCAGGPTPQSVTKAPILASYIIILKDLDEKIDNILDIQFLHGYYEPTLLLLYEPVRTFAGRTAVRNDTCAMAGVSLNLQQRVHPIIWSTGGLPFDCLQAVAIEKPLGGCLILAVNSLIYLNQSIPPYGVSLNSVAGHTTNFPLRIQEGVCISLDAACVVPLGEGRLALSLKGGQLYVVTLLSDSVRSVSSFHLDRAAASVLTTCMCVIEEDFLFLGSRLGNSLLLRVTERENRMLFSIERPLGATIDLTSLENEKEKEKEKEKEAHSKDSDPASKKRRLDTLSDCVASNVIEISDKDELEVYGSDIRTSTQLTSYVFEVCDSLLNICPIGDVSMGEPQLLSDEYNRHADGPLVELVCTSGHGKNGALTVLQRSIRPQIITTFNLPGCIDMWTVIGESGEAQRDVHKDMEGIHAYMILTQDETSMVLQTGQEINEVDNSGFMTSAPTIFAGNLGNNRFMVQVTTIAIRLVKNGQQVQNIQLEWTACYACTADPYLCVVSSCGRALVLALRESKGTVQSVRLVPTRQHVPHKPPLVKATPYRDLSGLFTTSDVEPVSIKGEFDGKNKMKGKNVKAEGFKQGVVYELNDEDELLYGGDQTPASMASIMLAEQSKNPGVPRRISRWWKKYLVEIKPTYWLFVIRDNGNLEIYSLPEMRLSFLVRDICGGARILADSLESVSAFGLSSDNEEIQTATQGQSSSVDIDNLREILVAGLGNKGSRVLMFLRMKNELMIYQVYKYPRGNLKMRFSRVQVHIPIEEDGDRARPDNDSYETWLLHDNVRQLRYFGNVGGYNGVFVCGQRPHVVLLTPRGELRAQPLGADDGPLTAFASFNNPNCPQGFLYFNSKSELRICALATHLSYDAPWPVRKVPIRMTPHFVTFHLESKTYCLVASTSQPGTSYYKFNGEDKELANESKGDRFPYPMQDRFSVMLFSPVSWEIIPNTKIELDEWEHVTCLKNVSLSYEGTRSGLRGYIALGTNYNYGEDITSRGRILIYDIIDVVPEPGQPLTKNRFKEIYAKEQKGPVTAMTQVLGYLISAVGCVKRLTLPWRGYESTIALNVQHSWAGGIERDSESECVALERLRVVYLSQASASIYIWQLKDNDLVGVAFIDTQIYVHKMLAVKNLVLIADVYKSISLLRYQAQHRTLSLVSRDLRTVQVYDMEFMVDNTNLGFLVSEAEGNFVMFMYQPQARESYGGQRLIRKSDYHLGQHVNAMFRIKARALPPARSINPPHQRHVTMFGGVRPLSLFYSDASVDAVEERSLVPRSRSHATAQEERDNESCFFVHAAGVHRFIRPSLDGGLGYVLPLSERTYRRLLMLQNVLNNYCCHIAGLNPRAYRSYKSSRRPAGGGAARGILDGDLVFMYQTMPHNERLDIAKKIGTKVDEVLADLNEIDLLTAHF
ncbi:Cleavage and polyadenylation specificity factor subunit 1 [Eumeta japonica]|uniref:Cleavage and polyadenylation specificity factor subunit 1 n=1 Tax=Eumeta variegata TaxID=151549 RepID=A0A4C1VNE8_EUMVA|nr:Cleavage and polyadenylation specificity factor subunit 1 [Eumeta japonica]